MVGFWYSAVHVKSEQSHRVKALLGSRDQLVRAKRALGNQVRGVLRPFGIRLPSRQGMKKVFYGGPSGSATRCNVQCERDGAVWKRWRQSRLRLRAWISNSRSWRDARKFVGGSNRSQQAGIEWPVDGYGFTLLSKCNYCICESFGQPSK